MRQTVAKFREPAFECLPDDLFSRVKYSCERADSGVSELWLVLHWAARIRLWTRGLEPNDAQLIAPEMKPPRHGAREVYVYFDNDAKVRAPADAHSLKAKLR